MEEADKPEVPNRSGSLRWADKAERASLAAAMGSKTSPRKAAAAKQNAQNNGRKPGYTHTPEERANQSKKITEVWAKKKAAGVTYTKGRDPLPLEQIACNCGGEGLNHRSTCPRGRAIRRRKLIAPAADTAINETETGE